MILLASGRLRRLQAKGMTECGFRVVEGSEPGFSRRWKHGVARLSKNQIEFRPGIGMGIRFPRPGQPWLRLSLMDATRAHERVPGLVEPWAVNHEARILLVRTQAATLEWALVAELRQWARRQVATRCTEQIAAFYDVPGA